MKELFRIEEDEGHLYLVWRNGNARAKFNKKIIAAIRRTINQKGVKK